MTASITREQMLEEATLHAQGLEHQATCQAANKRMMADTAQRTRERIPVAWAIVEALGGQARRGRARA